MANGDTLYVGAGPSSNGFYQGWVLLDALGATSDGQWVDFQGFSKASLEVAIGAITLGNVVKLRGSNALTRPANTSHGEQIGGDITSDGIVDVDTPVRWIKAYISTYGSGTLTVRLFAVHPG